MTVKLQVKDLTKIFGKRVPRAKRTIETREEQS